jgi:hypothetical protein
MSEPFVLIDLTSQYDAVKHYIEKMETADILNWLKQFGEILEWSSPFGPMIYEFHSNCGPITRFHFSESNELIVFQGGWIE